MHAYHLAGRALPPPGSSGSHVQPALLDLLDRLAGTPAQVITDLHVTLVQNPLARALLGAPPAETGFRASLVTGGSRTRPCGRIYPPEDKHQHGRSFVADLRAAVARRGGEAGEATDLVQDVLRLSPEFSELWARHDVAVRLEDRKRIVHPSVGVIDVNCLNLFSEDGRQRLLWFTPAPETKSIEQLELLRVVGTQELMGSWGLSDTCPFRARTALRTAAAR